MRVKFPDATNGWKPAERLIAWPGYSGAITTTEALELPGKTDPAEIWREARRRMLEAIHRPDRYEVWQDGPLRVATRGHLVALSHDVLDDTQRTARVKAVLGSSLQLDELLPIEPGQAYGIRFRVFDGASDTIGRSVVRLVAADPGDADMITLTGTGDMPAEEDLILFGRASTETRTMIVTGVEMGEDMACLLRLVDAAPQIDTILSATPVPPWTGRVGTVVPASQLAPAEPRWRSISSGLAASSSYDNEWLTAPVARSMIAYEIVPGTGGAATRAYQIMHRLKGSGT